jgi:hypothetical protein
MYICNMDIFVASGPSTKCKKKLVGCIFNLVIEINIPTVSYDDAVRNDSLI